MTITHFSSWFSFIFTCIDIVSFFHVSISAKKIYKLPLLKRGRSMLNDPNSC